MAVLALMLPVSLPADEVFPMVTIGAPGNPPDANGLGQVDVVYQITRDPISNHQYARFLNFVDPDGENRLSLYHPYYMEAIRYDASREPGHRYLVRTGRGNAPVRGIEWSDAARYVNWVANGGGADADTEKGSYDLGASQGRLTDRVAGGRFFIASENEWYKAMWYHVDDGNADRNGYTRTPRWPGALQGETVMEIVDPREPREAIQPVARPTTLRFPFLLGEGPLTEREARSFRLVDRQQPEPVGERVGESGDAGSPFPWMGTPFGNWPSPIYPDDENVDPVVPPVS